MQPAWHTGRAGCVDFVGALWQIGNRFQRKSGIWFLLVPWRNFTFSAGNWMDFGHQSIASDPAQIRLVGVRARTPLISESFWLLARCIN